MRKVFLILTLLCSGGFIASAQTMVDTLQIFFRQGQSQWSPEYMGNSDRFTPFSQKLASLDSDSTIAVSKVVYIAGGSPEGSRRVNERLSKERASRIAEMLHSHISFEDSLITTMPVNEDWRGLAQLVKGSGMPHEAEVLALLEKTPAPDNVAASNALKAKLKKLHGGKPWNYMYSHFFPSLRGAKVIIYYQVVLRPELQPEPEPLPEPPLFIEPVVVDTAVQLPLPEPEPVIVPEAQPETRFFAAKTNLLFLAGTIANLGFEMELGRKWSIDIPVYYSPYDLASDRKIRVLATQPELRRWLNKAGEGHFFGLHGHLAGFNIAINDHGRYQDPERPLWGFGLGYGFALNFGKKKNWGMEFNIGVGFANYEYEAFYNRPNGQVFETGEDWYWGVTRAGITLTYKWWVPRKASVNKSITAL